MNKAMMKIWLVDYSNPVATYNPLWGNDNLPDGYKYDGTEVESLYNVECIADKLTFTAKQPETAQQTPHLKTHPKSQLKNQPRNQPRNQLRNQAMRSHQLQTRIPIIQ